MNQVPVLHLLKAEHLPVSIAGIRADLDPAMVGLLAELGPVGSSLAGLQLLAAVDAVLARIGPAGAVVGYTDADRAAFPDDRYEEHDEYFAAVRVGATNRTWAFARTMIEALGRHLRDVTTAPWRLTAEHERHIIGGFEATFRFLRSCATDAADLVIDPVEPAPRPPERPLDPLLRWKLGHQVFFAHIQSLIVLLNCVNEALDRSDPAAAETLDVATIIMRGSASALRYAGDFSSQSYARTVRPAMMPPHLEPRFSGLQLRDHRVLLRRLASLKTRLMAGPGPVAQAYARFVDEMMVAYDAHVFVCAQFGGDREPSLRQSTGNASTAVEVLERFKVARRRMATGG